MNPETEYQTADLRGTAYLSLIRGREQLGQTCFPVADNFLIGRSRANHLQLNERSISRQHARLRCAQGAWFIQDQESRLGVYVNGRRVLATRLNPGDQIQIGGYVFEFGIM